MRPDILLALSTAALASCGGTTSDQLASIYKSAGSVQCGGGGTSLAAMQRQLTDAGIPVSSAACGADGRAYPALCGAPDGRINIFDIPAGQVQAATALGFATLDTLPSASRVACPA